MDVFAAIRAVGFPDDLFADVAPKVLASWRARVAAEAPSHLRSHPHEIMVTLLAAYLYCRQREITDALVDLLIATVQVTPTSAYIVMLNDRGHGPARSQLPEMVSACSLSAGGGGNRRGPRQPWHSGR